MGEVIVKKDKVKVDPRNPKSDPSFAYAESKAKQLMKKRGIEYGKVDESKGLSEDYWRRVKNNPNNLPGTPAFFPEIKIRSAFGGIKPARECECGGCAIQSTGFTCPRCKEYVPDKNETTN